MDKVLGFLSDHAGDMLADLETFVTRETPSTDKELLDEFAGFLARYAADMSGGIAEMVPSEHSGNHVILRVSGSGSGEPVLLMGHYDTVWPVGSLRQMPFAVKDGVARGPGIFDMKSGLIQGLWALRALKETQNDHPPVTFILNSDEELGSPESRRLIAKEATHSRFALVLEPSFDGALKTARKGVGHYIIRIQGRAAHAGLNPQAGISAIDELARVVEALHAQTDFQSGTTVNVGTIDGGTRYNVVAAQARAEVDVRFQTPAERDRIDGFIHGLRPHHPDAVIQVEGGVLWPPLQATAASLSLFDKAHRIGKDLGGLDLGHVSVGGASDGNTCGAAGIPVLDGLGAVGGGAHAITEHVLIGHMPVRAALVAGLISAADGT